MSIVNIERWLIRMPFHSCHIHFVTSSSHVNSYINTHVPRTHTYASHSFIPFHKCHSKARVICWHFSNRLTSPFLTISGSGSRLSPLTTPPCERSPHMTLTLQEILIVGSACEQAKFSELTMDMFRMLQTLEREPNESNHAMMSMSMGMHGQLASVGPHDSSPATKLPYSEQCSKGFLENGEKRPYRDNPHKYLLYKPSISQLLVFLASGFKELPPGGALLLYISADGCFSTTQHPEDCKC